MFFWDRNVCRVYDNGFLLWVPKMVSTYIFWNWTRLTRVTLLRDVCYIQIIETGHSKITLLLQLNYSLQNLLIVVKHPEDNHTQVVARMMGPEQHKAVRSKSASLLTLKPYICISFVICYNFLNLWISSY